jgi:hypothetical protein
MIVPLLLTSLALLLAYVGSRNQLSRGQFLIVAMFLTIGAITVLFPQVTTQVARIFDVGRGADLLLYFAVLCGVFIAANFYFRFKQSERQLTEIVRQIAIQSAARPGDRACLPS